MGFDEQDEMMKHKEECHGENPGINRAETNTAQEQVKDEPFGGEEHNTFEKDRERRNCNTSIRCASLGGDLLNRQTQSSIGKKRFQCDVCSKSFGYRHHLQLHTRIHTGERPHKCNECDKSFKQSAALKKGTSENAQWRETISM